MQDQVTAAIAILQDAKKKGLSYYDAVQSLKTQDFSQEVIDDASNRFDYSEGVIRSTETAANSPEGQAEKQRLEAELESVDLQLRKDQLDEGIERGFERI